MKIIVIGCGKIGKTIIEHVSKEGHSLVIVDNNREKLEELIERYDVIFGFSHDREPLQLLLFRSFAHGCITFIKEKTDMLQKELAKRLKARYDTKMDGNGWLEVSSDGIPLCRIKYNGQFLSNADKNLSDEYRSKIADIQDEISTVREYVGLYEHAPQMKAADVSEYRQLASFGDTVCSAVLSALCSRS